MESENFERGHKREFGDDPRDAEHCARYRSLYEDIIGRDLEDDPRIQRTHFFQRYDSPTAFVADWPDADEREEKLPELERLARETNEMAAWTNILPVDVQLQEEDDVGLEGGDDDAVY